MADQEIDAATLEACRHGDRDAFRVLYEIYGARVYSICLYFFHGNEADASDVTQEVFLKLFAGVAGFRGEAGFSTWLYRLVRNACLDSARRKSSAERRTAPPGVDPVTPEERLLDNLDSESVQFAVSSLPPKFRLPILLRYFDELSYEEMSKAMNCSMGTVASRLNRGHRMLSQLLAPLRERLLAGGGNVS